MYHFSCFPPTGGHILWRDLQLPRAGPALLLRRMPAGADQVPELRRGLCREFSGQQERALEKMTKMLAGLRDTIS